MPGPGYSSSLRTNARIGGMPSPNSSTSRMDMASGLAIQPVGPKRMTQADMNNRPPTMLNSANTSLAGFIKRTAMKNGML